MKNDGIYNKDITVVVPVKNESGNIANLIQEIDHALQKH